jgi:hypothetical protein
MPIALIPVRLPGKPMKKILITFLAVLVFSASTPAFADYEDEEVESIDVVVDVAFVRPLGLVSIAVGVTLFIISLPFTVVSGDTDKAARITPSKDPSENLTKEGMEDIITNPIRTRVQ